MSWENGQVDGDPGRVNQSGSRIEGLWGGDGQPDGPNHGHIVSNDGLNADYVRDPGGYVPVDNAQQDPYAGYQR